MADALYVQVEVGFPHSKLVDRARVKLNVSTNEAIGLFVRLWLAVLERHTGGSLVDRSDSWIEESAGWRGAEGAFAKLVREHHLDPDQRIRDWQEKYGALEAKRLRQREKKRAQRHPVPGTGVGTVPGTEGGPLITSSSSSAVSSTQEANPEKDSTRGEGERVVDIEIVAGRYGEYAPDVAALLRSAPSPWAVEKVLRQMDMQASAEEVGQAVLELLANGKEFNTALLRGYLRSVRAGIQKAATGEPPKDAEEVLRTTLAWSANRGGFRIISADVYATLPPRVRRALSAAGGLKAYEAGNDFARRQFAKDFCAEFSRPETINARA